MRAPVSSLRCGAVSRRVQCATRGRRVARVWRTRGAREARGADGRRAFLTTLAAVSFANDEILSTRGTIDRRYGPCYYY